MKYCAVVDRRVQEELDQMRSARQESCDELQQEQEDMEEQGRGGAVQRVDGEELRRAEREARREKLAEVTYAKKVSVLQTDGLDSEWDGRDSTATGRAGSSRGASRPADGKERSSRPSTKDGKAHGSKEERQLLWHHLSAKPPSQPATAPSSPRPLSARSKFLLGLAALDFAHCFSKTGHRLREERRAAAAGRDHPQGGDHAAGHLQHGHRCVRYWELCADSVPTHLAHCVAGNEMAALLAESLDSLPLLEGLCIGDNHLTDQVLRHLALRAL